MKDLKAAEIRNKYEAEIRQAADTKNIEVDEAKQKKNKAVRKQKEDLAWAKFNAAKKSIHQKYYPQKEG